MSLPSFDLSGDETFSLLIEGLEQSLQAQAEERRAFWQTLAYTIDEYCRWLIPLAYTAYLAVLFDSTSSIQPPSLERNAVEVFIR